MKDITIYTTTSCHYCQLAKQYFKEHNIPYTEYNVGEDIQKRNEMVELSGQLGVPVIRVGDTVLVGFQEKMFADVFSAN